MLKAVVKLSSRFLILGIFIGGVWFYTNQGFSQTEEPSVTVIKQSGSPLLVQITYVDTSNPLQPRYGYSVTNVGDKPIRAYTIEESTSLGPGAPVVHTTLSNIPAVVLLFKPYEVKQEQGGLSSTYKVPPIRVELTVDFVEFADGARWGDDTSESGDRLDGIRAGGKAAISMYRQILASQGVGGLERALAGPDSIPRESHPKSNSWSGGFDIGVGIVKGRLIRAKEKKGQDEMRRELDKPFDSTEGRQEP